jgi:hypothetical protein
VRRRDFIKLIVISVAACPLAHGRDTLTNSGTSDSLAERLGRLPKTSVYGAFPQGMQALGYVEGKDSSLSGASQKNSAVALDTSSANAFRGEKGE